MVPSLFRVVSVSEISWNRPRIAPALVAAALCCLGVRGAAAQQKPDGWTFDAGLYGWLAGLSGTIGVRGTEVSIDQSFIDTVRKASTLIGLMGHAEAHHDDFSVILDAAYTGIKFKSTPVGPLTATPRTQMTIVDFAGAYRVGQWWLNDLGDRTLKLEALAGGRFNSVSGKLDFSPIGGAQPPSVSQGKDWVDPIVGFRVSANLSEAWDVSLRGDIGGFGVGSDFTWQVAALAGYRFRLWGSDATAGFGYRALSWHFSNGGGAQQFRWNTTLHGPVIGLLFHF